jgi:hypothetical protein
MRERCILLVTGKQVSSKTTDDLEGYVLYPSRYSPKLGHPQVDIVLTSEPSGRFFDARSALFPISEGGRIRHVQITHPPLTLERARLCAGRISLHDHDDDLFDLFSFGGLLEIVDQGAYTLCRATSPAPILTLGESSDTVEAIVVSELEAMLARERAAWGTDDAGFDERLAAADPYLFFVAGLAEVRDRLYLVAQGTSPSSFERYHQELRVVDHTIDGIRDSNGWPAAAPPISQILGKI